MCRKSVKHFSTKRHLKVPFFLLLAVSTILLIRNSSILCGGPTEVRTQNSLKPSISHDFTNSKPIESEKEKELENSIPIESEKEKGTEKAATLPPPPVPVAVKNTTISNSTRSGLKTNATNSKINATAAKPPPPPQPPPSPYARNFLKQDKLRFDILPKVSCQGRQIELVISVPVTRDAFLGRQVIRESWGSYAYNSSNNAILLFFVGSEKNPESDVQKRIRNESAVHGDIVQGNFLDTYNNLTLKSVSILKWVTTYCPNSVYILKADVDMYINVQNLVSRLKNRFGTPPKPSAFVIGNRRLKSRPIRNPRSKWFLSSRHFRESLLPTFVSGTAYAMSVKAASLMYNASRTVPFLYLEDVYLTGLCARHANVTVFADGSFSSMRIRPKPNSTMSCTLMNRVSAHRYGPQEIMRIHRNLTNPALPC